MSETKRAEWTRSPAGGTRHVLRVGGVCAVAHEDKPAWIVMCDDCDECDTFDHAKELAESKLREMHDALVKHFAPVLRWTRSAEYPSLRIATLGQWRLVVEEHSKWWELFVGEPGNLTRVAWDKASDPDAAQLAAETALRALGVVFRVEQQVSP